ncbi:MAG TPA: DNA double-strand break repair nuclease NurA [Candidatus Nanopelagicaceae bacterium]|nr:DNA double-strand break repair nuclease NurA [Candidatus Nanopelagicaceae bacterium]
MTVRNNTSNQRNINLNSNSIDSTNSINSGFTKEQILLINIKNIAQEYIEIERLKNIFVEILLANLESLDFKELLKYPRYDIKENFIKKPIQTSNIRGLNIVSVDGSSVVKKFMNVDFSFLKAIAVKYYFHENQSSRIEYFPDIAGFNNYNVQGNYLNREENVVEAKISMDMTFMEINLLNNLIEKKSDVDLIILDGSIVIMPINLIFTKDSEISKRYDTLLKEYQKLYSNCIEKGIILIGSIKDTRTSALTNLLRSTIQMLKPNVMNLSDFIKFNYRRILDYFSDLDLYYRVLLKTERSCIFNCKKEVDKIRDTGIKKEIPYYFPFNFYAFYLKTATYDTPCRIEFFMDEKCSAEEASEKADLISSILLPISSLNEFYGLPIPQIEAHKRAVFKPQEINLLFNNLSRTLKVHGVSLLEKRRTRRPF